MEGKSRKFGYCRKILRETNGLDLVDLRFLFKLDLVEIWELFEFRYG